MSVQVTCPQCSRSLKVPQEQLGKRGKCPGCQSVFELKAAATGTLNAPASTVAPTASAVEKIVISCGSCEATLRVPATVQGKAIKCPKCSEVIAVPSPSGDEDPYSTLAPSTDLFGSSNASVGDGGSLGDWLSAGSTSAGGNTYGAGNSAPYGGGYSSGAVAPYASNPYSTMTPTPYGGGMPTQSRPQQSQSSVGSNGYSQATSLMLAGGSAAIVSLFCAILWAVIAIAIERRIGWMGVGVGLAVGFAVRFAGSGSGTIGQAIAAGFALAGCLGGDLLILVLLVASNPDVTAQEIAQDLFGPIMLLFYGLAMFEAYKIAETE